MFICDLQVPWNLWMVFQGHFSRTKAAKEMASVEKMVQDVTVGKGIVHLVDEETKKLLGIEDSPYLRTQVYNTRDASAQDVEKLWKEMGCGANVQWMLMEHEVIIGVNSSDDLAAKWDDVVVWSEKGKSGFAVLINGLHRLQMVKTWMLSEGLLELKQFLKEKNVAGADKLRAELRENTKWTAKIVDLGEPPERCY